MKVYTYSPGRASNAPDSSMRRARAERSASSVAPEENSRSWPRFGPLDPPLMLPGADTEVTREDILAAIRESRERDPGHRRDS